MTMDTIPTLANPDNAPGRPARAVTRLLAALWVALTPVGAAIAEDSPWYQVEVIVFAQSDPYRAEANLKSVRPAYPDNRIFLDARDPVVDPAQLAHLSPEDLRLYRAMVPESQLRWRNPREPLPYVSLEPGERLLAGEARALGGGTYQVLYHQAWRQTLASASASPWVVVQGGRPLGQHHELEGSLRIYRGNDGHINVATRLWRPHFGTATAPGSETAAAAQPASAAIQWPTLPLPPAPPRKALSAFFALDDGDEGLQPAQQSAPPPTQTLVDLDVLEHAQIINSRELHYLDHPRLGALVRVVPYQLPGDEAAGDDAGPLLDEGAEEAGIEDMPPEGDEPRD
ncbi:MAG: CsiV family protein [Porticoccaceae bacterium]